LSTEERRRSQRLGRQAELSAERYLAAQGLRTVARNHRFARGEIDIVMLDGSMLVFVEVRHRGSDRFGSGAESVFTIKQQRLVATAQHFLQTHAEHAHRSCRFDVAVVSIANEAAAGSGDGVEWIRDAFQA
jgi:putative endonuclease